MIFLNGITVIVLVGIAIQDFKSRAVYWWLFPLSMLCLGVIKSIERNLNLLVQEWGYNVIFLGIQFSFLFGYFSLKERRMVNIFKGYFGLGDLFFLLSITVYFSFLNYLLYYLFSLFIVIGVSSLFKLKNNTTDQKIPLAGYQAIMLIFLIIIDQFLTSITFTSDDWLIKYFRL